MTTSHAPSANFATAKITVTIAGRDRADAVDRPRSAASPSLAVAASQWTTIPACDSVIEVNTPIAYSGISASTRPPNAASTTIARTASATIPALNARRSPRKANRAGM